MFRVALKLSRANKSIMNNRHQIVRKSILAVLVPALMSLYLGQAAMTFCLSDAGKSMTCCKSESKSKSSCDSESSNSLSFQSSNKCPCPSMQSGRDKGIDEILPSTIKVEPSFQSAKIAFSLSETNVSLIQSSCLTGSMNFYLPEQKRLSLFQTFLI